MGLMFSELGFGALGVKWQQDELRKFLGGAAVDQGQLRADFSYTFSNHFHPFIGELLEQLNRRSIDGLLDAEMHARLERLFFADQYAPNSRAGGMVAGFPKQIEVDERGAYALYNWELLFHVPLAIAVHLSRNQRFAESQRWFHYIFDPTARDGRSWRFLAFRQERRPHQVDELLRILSEPGREHAALKELIVAGYERLREQPFQPHAVARTRFLAYQYAVVMKYLDNLIAWGDSLFRQDTVEGLNEAMQIYVLAANLLGPRPQRVPRRGTVRVVTTFHRLRERLDRLGNALVEMEGRFPFDLFSPGTARVDADRAHPLFGLGRALYFCIPRNETLLAYWDTVADRLFKIRHCMNIEGVVRQLPLFDPPIDPGMLVKAAAAGIDTSRLVSGLHQPLAPVRSPLLVQKALEICGEVRALGSALLAALEKKDGEALGLLRQQHEIGIQQLVQEVRFLQWKEAESATESLLAGRQSALERYRFYRRVLGKDDDEVAEVTIERQPLTEESFDEVYAALVGQYAAEVTGESYPGRDVEDAGRLFLSPHEHEELNVQMPLSVGVQTAASINEMVTSVLYYIPNFEIKAAYWGIGGSSAVAGGEFLGRAGQALTSAMRGWANIHAHLAAVSAKTSSYERRADEWMLQCNLAARDLMQIGRQIISSLIREQIGRHEYETVKRQIAQAREADRFLREKFTSEELYGWMQGELSKLYYEYYRLAVDIARKAELAVKHELMRPELDALRFIQFNYWDGGRKGLLSGEALHLDVRRLETAFHEQNRREYELTRHVSLRQLDPVALLSLKATGSCEVTVPEWFWDLDCPGHYMRRIKTVSLSIPSVVGPYTSLNCTLSLLKSTVRRSSALRYGHDYARAVGEEDARFLDYHGTIQSIVTSQGQHDGGLFETALRDERFLPFEGHGVESTWRLELPAAFRQFDYLTIADVILHVRYTARAGGATLRDAAVSRAKELVSKADAAGLMRVFSLRHDFPAEWHRFVTGAGDLQLIVKKEHFPYFAQTGGIGLIRMALYEAGGSGTLTVRPLPLDTETLREHVEISIARDMLGADPDASVFLALGYTVEVA